MLKTTPSVATVAIIALLSAWTANLATAQQSRHLRRITKSFTEPALQSVAASPEIGIIVEAGVQEGDRVSTGDVLAKINQRVLVQSLAIAEARASSTARLDAASSQLELVKSQLKAIKSLVAGGHTNQFEVDQKQAEYQSAYAEFRAAEDEGKLNSLEVKRIKAQIEDRTIRSPIDGFVTEIHKQLGENISNNKPEYATVVQIDELKVRFYLEAETLNTIQQGDNATILLGRDRKPTPVSVVYVSPIIDADSGLGRLDVRIDNHQMKIKSGTLCFWADDSRGTATPVQAHRSGSDKTHRQNRSALSNQLNKQETSERR